MSGEVATNQAKQEDAEPQRKAISDEERASGAVAAGVFMIYFRNAGLAFAGFVLSVFAVSQTVKVLSDYWLVIWSSSTSTSLSDLAYYLGIYGAASAVFAVLAVAREISLVSAVLKASCNSQCAECRC